MSELATPQMTNEEMIDSLKGLVFGTFNRTTPKERDALNMAIGLLENPCEDAISRQSALEQSIVLKDISNPDKELEVVTIGIIKHLKPVRPIQKVGKWICDYKDLQYANYHCSVCDRKLQLCSYIDIKDRMTKGRNLYCDRCGTKMKEEE